MPHRIMEQMRKSARRAFTAALFIMLVTALTHQANGEPLWRQLTPRPKVDADPGRDYGLAESNGPWLILAATFSGEGAEQQARDLVHEFRADHSLPAYLHRMTFDLAAEAPMRGRDRTGRPKRAKYQRGDAVTEFAVLVGDYPAVDDTEAQRVLERVKSLKPVSLTGERTNQNLAGLRTARDLIHERAGKKVRRGPMGNAMLTRNPLLPRDYFVPKGVDDFVVQMNRGVAHSLLDCPGRYTVKVATFRGRTSLEGAVRGLKKSKRSSGGEDPLAVAAENAHLLTHALRKEKGWEAFEFHDRTESIVTVGSFDNVANRTIDGREVPTREVQTIIRTFSAAFEPVITNSKDLENKRRRELAKHQFQNTFAKMQGQAGSGLHPKFFVGIPFDIHPQLMEVPRQSISSAYVRK